MQAVVCGEHQQYDVIGSLRSSLMLSTITSRLVNSSKSEAMKQY